MFNSHSISQLISTIQAFKKNEQRDLNEGKEDRYKRKKKVLIRKYS